MGLRRRTPLFPELSYASATQPPLKRWFIRSVEGLSGRDRYARLYAVWRERIVPGGSSVFAGMLDLIDVTLRCDGQWPPAGLPDGPLVIVANHPYGIGDGVAILSLAEQLGRPFRVMIHADLLRVREMEPYALPVDFSETRAALVNNMAMRKEAVRLLKDGVTIVVFLAGGVATAPKGFGRAEDLPWKLFPARLVQEARASVVPIYFSGQNGRLFHLASRVSMTARTSLLIREFARLSGRTIEARIGPVLSWGELSGIADRKQLTARMFDAVFSLGRTGRGRSVSRSRLRWPDIADAA